MKSIVKMFGILMVEYEEVEIKTHFSSTLNRTYIFIASDINIEVARTQKQNYIITSHAIYCSDT